MKHANFKKVILFVMVLLVSACSPRASAKTEESATAAPSQDRPVEDQNSLAEALRAGGAQVELGDPVAQAFFTVPGQILKVNGKDVQVFEYESVEAMEADAAQVAPDGGSVGTSMMMWVEPPHFFKSGRILVLYVGSDTDILGLLKTHLGDQFAGQ